MIFALVIGKQLFRVGPGGLGRGGVSFLLYGCGG